MQNNNEKVLMEPSDKKLREAFITLMCQLPEGYPGTGWDESDDFSVLLGAIDYIRSLENLLMDCDEDMSDIKT